MHPSNTPQPTLLDEPTDEILERICDAFCERNGKNPDPGVRFGGVHEFDVINHRFDGSIEHDGHTYGFVIQNGNYNGTEVLEWTHDPLDAYMGEVERPEPMTFVPAERALSVRRPGLFAIYCGWRREEWFNDLCRGMNYDRHFAPGMATNRYYREKAAKKGLEPGRLSNLTDLEQELVAESDAGKIGYHEIVRRLKEAHPTETDDHDNQ